MAPFSLESELGLPRTPGWGATLRHNGRPAGVPTRAIPLDPGAIAWSSAEGLASQICVGKDLRVEMFVDPSDVAIAHELATIAAEVALPYVSDAVDHSLKSDGSPVSACDLAVERALIGFLRHYRPNDGILSEESGEVALGERRWLLDPIDGTSQFVSGGPEWGTHVALEIGAQILLGIITRPLQRKRWWGVVGDGAFVDDDVSPDARSTRLMLSTRWDLSGARVGLYAIGESTVAEALVAAGASVHREGSPILEFVEGRLDAIVSDNCGFLWDHAPAVALTEAAGGRFTDPQGGTRADQQGGLYTNGLLDDQLWVALK